MITSQYTACFTCYCGYYDIPTASRYVCELNITTGRRFTSVSFAKIKLTRTIPPRLNSIICGIIFGARFRQAPDRISPLVQELFQDSYPTIELEYLVGMPYLSFGII